jgi:hypothetical protein
MNNGHMSISFELAIFNGYCSLSFKLKFDNNHNLSIDGEDTFQLAFVSMFHVLLGYGDTQTFNHPPCGPFGIFFFMMN